VYFALDLARVAVGRGELLARWHFTLVGMVAFYLCGGISVGVLIGLMLPLVKNSTGAAIVGTLALLPASYFMFTVMLPNDEDRSAVLVLTAIFSVLYGSLGGVYFGQKLFGTGDAESSSKSRITTLLYVVALGVAVVLLWLDLRFHIINK